MRATTEHDPVTWHHIAGAHKHRVTNQDGVGGYILHLAVVHAVRRLRRFLLQGPQGGGCASGGVPLEGLAAALHDDDDEAGQRLVERDRAKNRQRRDEVGRETPREDSAGGLPDDRRRRHKQPDHPDVCAQRTAWIPNLEDAAHCNAEDCGARDERRADPGPRE